MIEVEMTRLAEGDWFEIYSELEDRFEGPFQKAIEYLESHPEIGARSIHDPRFRRLRIQNTNYGIFYSRIGDRIMISAILDLRQNPEAIIKRLSKG